MYLKYSRKIKIDRARLLQKLKVASFGSKCDIAELPECQCARFEVLMAVTAQLWEWSENCRNVKMTSFDLVNTNVFGKGAVLKNGAPYFVFVLM